MHDTTQSLFLVLKHKTWFLKWPLPIRLPHTRRNMLTWEHSLFWEYQTVPWLTNVPYYLRFRSGVWELQHCGQRESECLELPVDQASLLPRPSPSFSALSLHPSQAGLCVYVCMCMCVYVCVCFGVWADFRVTIWGPPRVVIVCGRVRLLSLAVISFSYTRWRDRHLGPVWPGYVLWVYSRPSEFSSPCTDITTFGFSQLYAFVLGSVCPTVLCFLKVYKRPIVTVVIEDWISCITWLKINIFNGDSALEYLHSWMLIQIWERIVLQSLSDHDFPVPQMNNRQVENRKITRHTKTNTSIHPIKKCRKGFMRLDGGYTSPCL